ncbi:MAG: WecB/TagA/CpsF family glycosyltransferase [Desulfobacteraceae bacterium]|nr:WecB/TagA/CpsF family glycosyltransferase [Desulfobacteraceae bacterium]
MNKENHINWPQKHKVLNVGVSATTYDEVVHLIMLAAKKSIPALVTALPVHGVVTANSDPKFFSKLDAFNLVVPDGQPVRWALNWLYHTNLKDRVYGPEMMLRLCKKAAEEGISIYLYGSHPYVVEKLQRNLIKQYPDLIVAGYESPPFRQLTRQEDCDTINRINKSGAGLVFIGLGCPLQDNFAYEHQGKINSILLCVGAAFDFHSGNKIMAPGWMQQYGLEWLFRLMQEPKRLFKRYFYTNSTFVFKIIFQTINQKVLRK